jgi:cytochrome P450
MQRPPVTNTPTRPTEPLLPVSDTKAPPSNSPDLLSKFLAARQARPDFMSDALVQTMAVSMAFAGSETTAISLASVFYYLLRSPRAHARLRAELDAAGRAGRFADTDTGAVSWAEAQRLPYLDACVKEAFRLHPAAGLPLERIVPPRGAEIAGHFVKGGTIVGCSAWVIHRRPEIWGEDVEAYRPERWLVEEQEEGGAGGLLTPEQREERERKIREMNGMMFQFGMGSRTCIGKNISLLEIYKVVPSLLRRFEVSPSLWCSLPLSSSFGREKTLGESVVVNC